MSYRTPRGVMVLLFVTAALPAGPAAGQDFVKDTIPQKWVEPYVPEDLPALDFRAYDDDLSKAEQQVFSGRYKLALFNVRKIKDPGPELLPRIALVKGRALAARGRYQEAIEALQDARVADHPGVQALQAELLADLGRTDEALLLLNALIKAHPDSVAGRYWLGRVHELVGDLDAARQAYGWFVEPNQNFLERWEGRRGAERVREFESAEGVTTIARALDRWAQLSAKYRDNVRLHGTILNMFVRAYDVIDRGYWPARVAAAEYFMGHDQNKEAVAELQGDEETKAKGALDYNPNHARTLELLGLIALDGYNFDACDRAIEAIRAVNPNSPRADLLEARNLMLQRRPQDAIKPVQKVLSAQPKSVEALGLLAAVYALQLKDDRVNEVLKQVEALDPDNASAYFEVADRLGAVRQYPRAADKYKVAIERAPWWTAPRNGLGLLYTQSGDEKGARAVIEEARKLDPFNLATTNYIRLLDDMDHFAQRETEHFIVMYHPELDPVVPEYFSDYMESVHAEICAEFKTEPAVKTMIEVFPTHDAFSVRTTGSPWIGTVGASTGRVIALVSPRAGDQMGTFNWAQVLRHEYTHTVTLAATDNRIAHWMTEGLAVYQERTPMRWDWVPMLYSAVKKKELFSMEDLTWAFVRPRKPWHRTLAYAESFWVCKFVEEKWGHDAILKMLEEFRKGGHQDDVFPQVLGKPIPEFEREFFAWTEQQVATWGYDEETTKKYDELKEKAEGLIKAKQYDEAAATWEEIAKLRPADALPHQRLAGLYLLADQSDRAIEHLHALYRVELKDNRIAKRIARLHAEAGQLDKARQAALTAVYVAPYDLAAHQLLAEYCEKTGDAKGLERERRVIPMLEKWLAERKKEGQTAGAQ
jgi:cellulose synthase operon protein C